MNGDTTFLDAVDALRAEKPRFAREAYVFVTAALGVTVRELPESRREDAVARHLSGQELLAGVVRLARKEFGALAPMVFREWGVTRGEDVGTIVFDLVGAGQLSARPEDTAADFAGGPDLLESLAAGGSDPGTPPADPA